MPTFDARVAKQLQPGQHLTLDEAPGLRLVASASGRSWIYRYKSPVDGRMKQHKIGGWPAIEYARALGFWSELKAVRDGGGCPASLKKAGRHQAAADAALAEAAAAVEELTVVRLLDAFKDYSAGRRADKGWREMRRLFDTMVPAEFGRQVAARVRRSEAFDLISNYSETPVVARNLRQELGAAWDWAIDSGRLPEDTPNWWRVILRGKLKSLGKSVGGKRAGVIKTVLQQSDVGALIRFLPHVSRLPAELLTLYLWTGCRGAEICAMEGGEVAQEADGWWWTIPKAKTKLAKHPLAADHRVPLVGRALEIVRSRIDVHGDGYLFPPVNWATSRAPHVQQKVVGVAVYWHRQGTTARPNYQRPRWPTPHWAPHDLRRTVRTELSAIGCPKDVAEAVLGHVQPGIEGVYNRHRYDRERRIWLTKLDAHWEAAAAR